MKVLFVFGLLFFAVFSKAETFEMGPAGGLGGREFRDVLPSTAKISEVRVWHGSRIDAIQLSYLDVFGNVGSLSKRGGNGGSLSEFELGPNEYITKIIGYVSRRNSNRIFGLQLFTNLKSSPLYGVSQGRPFVYEAPTGYAIQGFGGASGDELDALSVFLRKR